MCPHDLDKWRFRGAPRGEPGGQSQACLAVLVNAASEAVWGPQAQETPIGSDPGMRVSTGNPNRASGPN